ncbi:MAG: imidazoleglycerol-phosphate dehydratase HisB [Lachnospiraceae bacterium]|nr:imidazoleglycerol-phosphate dehydratase HisB [Lachnospiraceae bacterium]
MSRTGDIKRTTRETEITAFLELDGTGKGEIDTGIGFFDHMLEGFTKHGLFDLMLTCNGDLDVDCHHTIEDCGIVLGNAIKKAVGDKKGISRYGFFMLPMDDALIACAIDLCGRPYFSYDLEFDQERIGNMDTSMIREFFYAVSYSGEMNLHLKMLSGINSHHIAEAAFKAFAKSLKMAVSKDERIQDVLSTKGVL